MSVWQLLDIITPNNLRDTHFCSRKDCCQGDLQVQFCRRNHILFETTLELEYERLQDFGWKEQKKEFWHEKVQVQVNDWIDMESLWLKGKDYSGDCPGRLMDSKLHIHPLWIIKYFQSNQ